MNLYQYSILVLLLLTFKPSYSQNSEINTLWCLGNNGVVFNTSTEAISDGVTHKLSQINASATVSDSSGNMLFYTNGYQVFNKNNALMEGGNYLHGSPLTAQTLVLPYPGEANANKYVLFSLPNVKDTSKRGIAYSIVNMNLGEKDSSGMPLGAVELESKNTLLNLGEESKEKNFKALKTEAITAVSYANDKGEIKGYWVLVPYGKHLHAYKLTEAGIENTPVESELKLSESTSMNFDDVGYITASGNLLNKEGYSHFLMFGKSGSFYSSSISAIRSFNNVTGKIVEDEKLAYTVNMTYKGTTDGLLSYGAAFSSDNKLLYLGCNGSVKVFDLFNDLKTKNIEFDNKNKPSYVGRGANGEIYVTGAGKLSFLSKIVNQNSFDDSTLELDALNMNTYINQPLPQTLEAGDAIGGVNCKAMTLKGKDKSTKQTTYKAKSITTKEGYTISGNQNIVFKAEKIDFLEMTDIQEGATVTIDIEECKDIPTGTGKGISKNKELKFDKDFSPKNSNVSVYPNPSSDYVEILSNVYAIKLLQIASAEGKVVNKIGGLHTKFYFLDISSLSEGVYFLTIKTSSGKSVVKKLVKKL